jgi:hypothetical protein
MHFSRLYSVHLLTYTIAYESRSRRHRRVQTRQAQGREIKCCSRRKQQLSTPRRIRREAYIGSYNHSRRPYHFPFRRISPASRSCCPTGSQCARWNFFDSYCWCWYCSSGWKRGCGWFSSKFTCVGYYGSVANMVIRDLLQVLVDLQHSEAFLERHHLAAEEVRTSSSSLKL